MDLLPFDPRPVLVRYLSALADVRQRLSSSGSRSIATRAIIGAGLRPIVKKFCAGSTNRVIRVRQVAQQRGLIPPSSWPRKNSRFCQRGLFLSPRAQSSSRGETNYSFPKRRNLFFRGLIRQARPQPGSRDSFAVSHHILIEIAFVFQKVDGGGWRCNVTAPQPVDFGVAFSWR